MILFVKGGNGISPVDIKSVIGSKLSRDLKFDDIIQWSDLV